MIYPRDFLDLQWRFAEKVAAISGLPLQQTLFEYTNFYVRFGCGRDFRPDHPVWQEYLAGLQEAEDGCEWSYRFYLTRDESLAAPPVVATFGCFSYALLPEHRLRLHFQNLDTEGSSSLGVRYEHRRRADLTALFEHVQQTLPLHTRAIGISWLYNIEAYRRLFPASYIATARTVTSRFQSMPLWGQFIDRHGALKEEMVRSFLTHLNEQTSIEHLHECFPLQALTVDAPVGEFYRFYGL